MAIIYSYPYVNTVNNSDTLVISVSDTTEDNGFLTKSLTADNLASYVTARVNLNFLGDTGTGVVNLDTQNLSITGTTNEIETAASSQTLQIGLPDNVTIANDLNVGTDLSVSGKTETNTLVVNTTASISGDTSVGGSLDVTNRLTVSDNQGNGSIIDSELSMSSNRITNLSNPVSSQDAATKSYVDTIISGGLYFRGSFRADTGEIISGANTGSYLYNCPGGAGTRVSVLTGDYYIVANTGGNFYCSGDLLNVGDSIIAVADAPADSSTVTDWATLESDNIEGTGLANTVPLWTDSQVLGNSMLSQDSGATKVTISGALDLSSNLINNVLDPVAAQDVATKAYVDAGNTGQATGTGTTQTLPVWSDGPNGALGDSPIKVIPSTTVGVPTYADNLLIGDLGVSGSIAATSNRTLQVGNSNNIGSASGRTARAIVVGEFNNLRATATQTEILNSTVIGNSNIVSASETLVVGTTNTVRGGTGFVAGVDNTTSERVPRQFVIGRANNVDSVDTIVLGDRNTVAETGAGFGSMMVFGHLNNVLGDRILCLGTSNTVNSDNQGAYIIGVNSSSTADRTYSIGQQNAITGNESYAFGKSNTIAAAASVAVGTNNSISAIEKAYAFGFGNDNINFRSFAIGDNNDVLNKQRTYLIGRENKPATDNTIILGQFSDPTVLRSDNPSGRSTVAFGVGVNNGIRRTAWEFRGKPTSAGDTSAGDSMQIMAWALLYSTSYADDTAAAAGSVEVGQLYRTGSTVKIRMT